MLYTSINHTKKSITLFDTSKFAIIGWVLICLLSLPLTGCNDKPDVEEVNKEKSVSSDPVSTNTHGENNPLVNNEQSEVARDLVAGKLLRIAIEGNYPPFNYRRADGNLSGLDIDITKALCMQMKAECQIVVQDWKSLLKGLQADKYDAIISSMSVTPERLNMVDFTEPYYRRKLVWIAHKDDNVNPANMSNKLLGSKGGSTIGFYLLNKYNGKQGNKVNLYSSYRSAYLDLLSGNLNAVLVDKVSAMLWLQKHTDFAIVGRDVDINDNIAIAVRKGDPVGLQFNQALRDIRNAGLLTQIKQVHFGSIVSGYNKTVMANNININTKASNAPQAPQPTPDPKVSTDENTKQNSTQTAPTKVTTKTLTLPANQNNQPTKDNTSKSESLEDKD